MEGRTKMEKSLPKKFCNLLGKWFVFCPFSTPLSCSKYPGCPVISNEAEMEMRLDEEDGWKNDS
jgi:hypothetical protein